MLLQDELDSQEFLKCFLISSSIYFFCLVFVWGQRLSWLKLYLIKEALDSQQTNWTIVLCNQVKYLSENFCLRSKWVFIFDMRIIYMNCLYSLQNIRNWLENMCCNDFIFWGWILKVHRLFDDSYLLMENNFNSTNAIIVSFTWSFSVCIIM